MARPLELVRLSLIVALAALHVNGKNDAIGIFNMLHKIQKGTHDTFIAKEKKLGGDVNVFVNPGWADKIFGHVYDMVKDQLTKYFTVSRLIKIVLYAFLAPQ